MNISPIEHLASLRVGTVEFVSPDQIKIGLDLEAPECIAANAGTPRAFPRINSYILVPTESGHLVGQVEWLTVERSPFPKRKGFQDYGLVDLPFPLRKMSLNPLGILEMEEDGLKFSRGVHQFPSIGEPALIPTDLQLLSIVESGENRRVKIGTSPMAANADVCVDPDRLFGRHLAVLGNTGSGKSCSVAGLIRWSLDAAKNSLEVGRKQPNARFIVLDPNGEYSKAFKESARVFRVGGANHPLEVPLWFWNSSEWCTFAQASARAQVPLLKQALRAMRNEISEIESGARVEARRFLRNILTICRTEKNMGKPFDPKYSQIRPFVETLDTWRQSLESFNGRLEEDLEPLVDKLAGLYDEHLQVTKGGYRNYSVFTIDEIEDLLSVMNQVHLELGGSEQDYLPRSEDVPTRFNGDVFVNYLQALAQETANEQYVEFLLTRIRTLISDTQMKAVIGDDVDLTLANWLEAYIGRNNAENGCVTIIDLSSVPSEIINVITAVVARMVLEALQRYRKLKGKSLPTALVMEEAHTFIRRYNQDAENPSASMVCCQIFEKIAREGRKFGLGLVISSQRPSELSPTVLSQCNSFLLHRVSNDRDQELIQRLVPDHLRGLLRELPSLPSQQAILLGWASELPIIVKMNYLQDDERPRSDDPDFWDVWDRE